MTKPKLKFAEKYKKDSVAQGKESVLENIKKASVIYVHELGKMDNGDEYLIYKVVIS
jgi:hypothetical protein